jgi:hypothetical protein
MNDRVFDIYRQASESWFKAQQELFDGLYKSTMLLFQQTAQAPNAKPSEDKATRTTPKPGAGKPTHSRKAAGRPARRPGAGSR